MIVINIIQMASHVKSITKIFHIKLDKAPVNATAEQQQQWKINFMKFIHNAKWIMYIEHADDTQAMLKNGTK